MLSAGHVSKSLGGRTVLAGDETPDADRVERAPASLTVGYLPQEPDARPGETLRAYLARRTGVAAASADLDRLTEALAKDPECAAAYSDALDRFLALGGDDLDARSAQTCAELGLPPDRLDVEVGALSGGQAARVALVAIRLSRFDVLLLDEPTNNLDFAGLDQLEAFVAGTPGAVIVVSHDRAFLDRAVHRILELQEETHHGAEYAATRLVRAGQARRQAQWRDGQAHPAREDPAQRAASGQGQDDRTRARAARNGREAVGGLGSAPAARPERPQR